MTNNTPINQQINTNLDHKELWIDRERDFKQESVVIEQKEPFLETVFEGIGSFFLIGVVLIAVVYMVFKYKFSKLD